MSDKILSIYKSILDYAGMYVDGDNTIYGRLTDSLPKIPITIGDKKLVFPVRQQFDDVNQDKYYFHPLSENFTRGESEVIEKLKEHINVRINFAFTLLVQQLLILISSPHHHKALDEDQAELLKQVGDADEKCAIKWSEIMRRVAEDNKNNAYVKIYLKHSGTWKGESYSRIGVITFPFYNNLIAGKYDDHIRVKDRPVFKKVIEFLIPGINQPESYNFGTRNRTAPFLEALMISSFHIAGRINEITRLYEKFIDNDGLIIFDDAWYKDISDIDNLRNDIRLMPELKGNAGAPTVSEKIHPAQTLSQPTYQPNPPEPVKQALPQPYPTPIQQVPSYQPVMQPVPTVPTVRQSANGSINFNDVLRANPMMAMAPNPMFNNQALPPHVAQYLQQYGTLPPNYIPNQMPQRAPQPTWAAPGHGPGAPPIPGYPQPQMQYPVMQQPQMYQQPAGQLPPPPPGCQYVLNPQTNQYVVVPIQPQPQMHPQMQQPMAQGPVGYPQPMQPQMQPQMQPMGYPQPQQPMHQGPPPPSGWNWR